MKVCGGCNQEETSPQKHCPGMQGIENQNLELKLVSNVKRHKKGFYRYSGSQKDNRRYCGHLTDTRHAKGWCSQCLFHLGIYWQGQASWVSMPSGMWDTYKRVDGTRWDPSEWTLRNQVKAIVRLLSIIFEKAQQSAKVLITRKKANVTPVFKKQKKEDSDN